MQLVDQIKTTQGRIPVRMAEVYRGDDGIERIRFTLEAPGAATTHDAKQPSARQAPTLEDLAFLWDDDGRVSRERLEKLARRTGPLFGAGDHERFSDWLAEAAMAKDVLGMQEVVNGARPIEALGPDADGAALVAKSMVRNRETSNDFVIYGYMLPLEHWESPDFLRGMPEFPHFKKFVSSGQFDYVFMNRFEEEGEAFLSVTLFAFKHDISPHDFVLALDACAIDGEEDVAKLMAQAEREVDFAADAPRRGPDTVLGSDALQAKDAPLAKDDLPHVQRLVQAVASLRLTGIGVDVFRSGEDDDFLTFPMYASYLWYGFSKKLGQIKIGYCQLCGRGFSLAGHRGLPRLFCSEECKTKAKNERSRRQRDEVRRLFLEEGLDVEKIARRVYAPESPLASDVAHGEFDAAGAERRVRSALAGYPTLKRMVDADLAARVRSPLIERCVAEGVFSLSYLRNRAAFLQRGRR